MKKFFLVFATLLCLFNYLDIYAENNDNLSYNLQDVIVTANRLPILLKNNPGSVSLITLETLSKMPKSIGIEEALRLTPGVRIDNQHDGERVHLSIRGQGILTERGLRGIGVLLDGIQINDPSGFAPDLYDVDWGTVENIQVLRGPSAGLYGSGSAAGIIAINTSNGYSKPIGGELSQIIGSNGFYKSLVQLGGSFSTFDYKVNYSRTDGDGYRDHQAFWSNKFYEKVNFYPTNNVKVTQIFAHTDYFQQNPEGLNLGQFDNLRQANPDANPFNEYQKTNRTTFGLIGSYILNDMNDFNITSYYRTWKYKETSNKAAEYRTITNPGLSLQYNLHLNTSKVKNTVSIGTDLKWQTIDMYKLQSLSNINRVESTDETNLENNVLLANQIIEQQSNGYFGLYTMEYDKLTVIANLRYDFLSNDLTNKMFSSDSSKTSKDFSKTSFRLGASYNLIKEVTLFANFSQGFMPPSTEELANNPVGYSGFNTHLSPATSDCFEFGARGFVSDKLYYELTGFTMKTKNDFFRFKQSGRGNQEVFYGNAGDSKRYGIESYISYKVLNNLTVQAAYTYSNFKYQTTDIDPVYTDPNYVLTNPPADGQWLPNSPEHQLSCELVYSPISCISVNLGLEYQSKWAIYTDSKAYNNELDPLIYQNWQDGFTLLNAGVRYNWNLLGFTGELSLSARNITNKEYMAFTEPDPDGNSYQPGPKAEYFGNIKIKF